MSALDFTTDIICKTACNMVVKQNCYQVQMMQCGNLDLDFLLLSKQKENPGWQKLTVLLFSWYMQTFLLFCWQWLEKYFIIKVALHSHFLMIIYPFFSFCLWKYLNASPVVQKLDGRKNLKTSQTLKPGQRCFHFLESQFLNQTMI